MAELFDDIAADVPALQFTGTTGRSATNNNPLNLEYRKGTYQDQFGAELEPVSKSGKQRFAKFPTMQAGYEAGLAQIRLDQSRPGMTLRSFVSKFAPSFENPTEELIAQYSKRLGVSPDTPLSQIEPERLMIPMMERESSTKLAGGFTDKLLSVVGDLLGPSRAEAAEGPAGKMSASDPFGDIAVQPSAAKPAASSSDPFGDIGARKPSTAGQAADPAYQEGYGGAARRGLRKGMIDVATRAAGAIDPASFMTGMGIMPGPDDPAWGAPADRDKRREVAQNLMTQALFPHGEPPKAKGWTEQLVEDLVETWPAAIGLMTMGAYGAPAGELLGWLGANIAGAAAGFGLYGLTDEDPLKGFGKGLLFGGALGSMKAVTAAIPNWIARWSTRIGGGAGLGYGAATLEGADAEEARKQAILFAAFELFAKPGEYVSPKEWSKKVGLNVTEDEVTKAKNFWDRLQDNYKLARENTASMSEKEYAEWVGQEYGDTSRLPVEGTLAKANLQNSILNEMEAIRAATLQHPESPVSAKELADALSKDPDYNAAVAMNDTAKRDAAAARVADTLAAIKTAQTRGETLTPLDAEKTELYLRKAAEERQAGLEKAGLEEAWVQWSRERRRFLDEPLEGGEEPGGPAFALKAEAEALTDEPEPLWYSRTERFLNQALPGSSDGAALAKLVQGWADKGQADKAGNVVHREELKWSGLVPWLEEQGGRKVSKGEVLAKLAEGQVEVREVERGEVSALTGPAREAAIQSLREVGAALDQVAREVNELKAAERELLEQKEYSDEAYAAHKRYQEAYQRYQNLVKVEDEIKEQLSGTGDKTKFRGYMNLPPGADNYRERVLVLPRTQEGPFAELSRDYIVEKGTFTYNDGSDRYVVRHKDDPPGQILGEGRSPDAAKAQALHWLNKKSARGGEGEFDLATSRHSGHAYGDSASDVNRVAHVFTWEMPLPGGKKMLVVGEVQSDWASEGRRKGYKTEPITELPEGYKIEIEKGQYDDWRQLVAPDGQVLVKVNAKHNSDADVKFLGLKVLNDRGSVPPFPFSENWHELVMKRMVRYAAENGYDRLGWVTGEMVKERYDLSRFIEKVEWTHTANGTYDLKFKGIDRNIPDQDNVKPWDVEKWVGKDVAKKILDAEAGERWNIYEKRPTRKAPLIFSDGYFSKEDAQRAIDHFKEHNPSSAEGNEYTIRREGGYPASGELSGLDLKVGGEWANRLYDSFDPTTGRTVPGLPQFVSKYAKQWGVRVEDVAPGTSNLRVVNITDEFGEGHGGSTPWWVVGDEPGAATMQAEATFATKAQAEKFLEQGQVGDKYHSIPIVPEMKKSAPLFAVKERGREGVADATATKQPGVSGRAASKSKYLEPEILGADPDAPAAPRSPGEPERFTTVDTARGGWVGGVPQNVEVGQRALADFASELSKRSPGHGRLFAELRYAPGFAQTRVFQEIAALARASGIDRIMAVDGARFDGTYVRDWDGRRWLFLDREAQPNAWNIANHEMFHFRVDTNDPNAMKLLGSIDTESPEFRRFRDALGLQYFQNMLSRPSAMRTMEEFAAHYVGRQTFRDINGKPIDFERGFRDIDQAVEARLNFDLRQEPAEPAYSLRDFLTEVRDLEDKDREIKSGPYKTEAEVEAAKRRARSGPSWSSLVREMKTTWAPETLSKTALDTAKSYVDHLTQMKAKALRTANIIRGYYRMANQLGEDATYKTLAQYERGEQVPLEWEPYYKAIGEAYNDSHHDLTHDAKGSPRDYRTIGYLSNYAGRLYKGDPEVAGRVLLELNNNYLAGRKGFLKNRVFSDTDIAREEMAKRGFFPAYENMVEQHMAVLMEQRRFAAADNFLDYLADTNRAVEMKGGKPTKQVPDDWVPISFTGRTVYVAPDAAAVIRAHFTPGASPLWYAKWRDMSVAWNSWHVAWSAFHGMTTTAHEISMGFAQNIPDFLGAVRDGDYPAAVKALKGIGPFRVAQALQMGTRGREEFNKPGTHSDLTGTVEAATRGGATPESLTSIQHSLGDSMEQMIKHLRHGQITPAFRDLLNMASKPIMGYWVPRIKYGSTLLRIQGEMEKLAKQYNRSYGSQEMWLPEVLADYKARMLNIAYNERQFSDNIFGEIDPDNLHWAKHGSRILSGFVGYPGWNRGTFSWIAGMGRGLYKGVKGLATEGSTEKIDYQARRSLQFGAGLLLTNVLANVMLGISMGSPPENWQDIFIGAKTGGVLSNGAPERVSIASYMKDLFPVLKWASDPTNPRHVMRVAESKLLFPFQMLKELERNADYSGMEIIRSKGNPAEKAMDLGRYVGEKAVVPFGASGVQVGQSPVGKYGGFVGLRRIPRDLSNTEAQNRIDELQHARMPQTRTREAVELSKLQKELRELGWSGERGEMERRLREARQQGVLTREQVDHIRKDTLQPKSRVSFNRLNLEDMLDVYGYANPFEKAEWRPLIMRRIRQARPETRVKLRDKITAIIRQPLGE